MKITSKTKVYYCDKDGLHCHHEGGRRHRVTGAALVGRTYNRTWSAKNHDFPFQETGPGYLYLNGVSGWHRIEGKRCSKEQYDNYCKKQKL